MERKISAKTAKYRMMAFLQKYNGKTVYFDALDDCEKLTYVMIKQFSFFSFLKADERMRRAINNAYWHKSNGYVPYYGQKMFAN